MLLERTIFISMIVETTTVNIFIINPKYYCVILIMVFLSLIDINFPSN